MGYWVCQKCGSAGTVKSVRDLRPCPDCKSDTRFFESGTSTVPRPGNMRNKRSRDDKSEPEEKSDKASESSKGDYKKRKFGDGSRGGGRGGNNYRGGRNYRGGNNSRGNRDDRKSRDDEKSPPPKPGPPNNDWKTGNDQEMLENRRLSTLAAMADSDRWCTDHHQPGHLMGDCPEESGRRDFAEFMETVKIEWNEGESREDRLAEIIVPPVDLVSTFNLLYRCNASIINAFSAFTQNRDCMFAHVSKFLGQTSGDVTIDPEVHVAWLTLMAQANTLTRNVLRSINRKLILEMRRISTCVHDHIGEESYGPREGLTAALLNAILFDLDLINEQPPFDASGYKKTEKQIGFDVMYFQQDMHALRMQMQDYLDESISVQYSAHRLEIEQAFQLVLRAQIDFRHPTEGAGLDIIEWPQLAGFITDKEHPPLPFPADDACWYTKPAAIDDDLGMTDAPAASDEGHEQALPTTNMPLRTGELDEDMVDAQDTLLEISTDLFK